MKWSLSKSNLFVYAKIPCSKATKTAKTNLFLIPRLKELCYKEFQDTMIGFTETCLD